MLSQYSVTDDTNTSLVVRRTRGTWIGPTATLIVLLSLLALSTIREIIALPTQFSVNDLSIDASWIVELENQLRQGNLLGRDTHFTYGPLAQLLVFGPALLRENSSALASVAISLAVFRIVGLGILVVILLLIRSINWAGALFIFSFLFLFGSSFYLRPFITVLGIALLAQALDLALLRRRLLTCTAGLIWFAGQLTTFELGIFGLLVATALLILCSLLGLPQLRRWQFQSHLLPPRVYLETLALCAGVLLAANLGLEIFYRASSPTYEGFEYLISEMSVLRGYSYTMMVAWAAGATTTYVIVLVLCYCVIGAFVLALRGDRYEFHLLIGLLIASLLHLRGAVIRSDIGHIFLGLTPSMILFTLILYRAGQRSWLRSIGMILLGLVVIFWPMYNEQQVHLFNLMLSREINIREKLSQIRSTQVDVESIAPSRLRAAVDSEKTLVVFPADNSIAIALGQRSLAPVLQMYAAFDTALQKLYVRKVAQQQENVEVIYGLDGLSVGQLGGVQSVSRNPVIFQYLYENFRLKSREIFRGGYIVLEPRKQPLPLVSTPLSVTAQPGQPRQMVVLPQPTSCVLLELDLTVSYPPTALLGRPTDLIMTIAQGDQVILQNHLVAIEAGKPFSTFVYLGANERLPALFTDSFGPGLGATFDRIAIDPSQPSFLDVNPSHIDLHGINCVERRGLPADASVPLRVQQNEIVPLVSLLPESFAASQAFRIFPNGIFIAPPNSLDFGPLIVAPDSCFISSPSIHASVAGKPGSDGAIFNVELIDSGIAEQKVHLTVRPGEAVPIRVPLPAEHPFILRLATETGEQAGYDWSFWLQPEIGPCGAVP